MLELDGGDGGGQLVRTALSLSALTGQPIRVENVRGSRPNPGLRPQHVAAVEAVAAAADATLDGVEPESDAFSFAPGTVRGGTYTVDVGSAGSATLVCDAVAPLAVALDRPLALTVRGGTDVKWSPPADFLRYVKLPLLRAVGVSADLSVHRRGFYPAGGGSLTLTLRPSSPSELRLPDRGPVERLSAHALASESLESASVADRMADAVRERLGDAGTAAKSVETAARYVESDCPGAVVTLVADCESSRAGFDAVGERGLPAEDVAARAVEAFRSWRATGAPVDEHLGDQLLLWVALAGGELRLPRVTDHVRTNAETIRAFGYGLRVGDGGESGADREDGTGTDIDTGGDADTGASNDDVVATAPPPER
jgi:RNA 3'-terminal phosphate cyclase (ATP)